MISVLATFKSLPDSIDEMIRAADSLMYEAKKGGKNSILQKTVDIKPE